LCLLCVVELASETD